MKSLLISACLLGVACRYDGRSKPMNAETLRALKDRYHLIPICPETLGGLPTPRIPAEAQPDRTVKRADGKDVTTEYQKGAEEALRLATLFDCKLALLKERSPSCGNGQIYNGTFSGILIPEDGTTAALFKRNDIQVFGESEIEALLK